MGCGVRVHMRVARQPRGHCNNPAVLALSFSPPSVFLKAQCRPRRSVYNPLRTPQPHGERIQAL